MSMPPSHRSAFFSRFFWPGIEVLSLVSVALLPFLPQISRKLSAAAVLLWFVLLLAERRSVFLGSRIIWICYPVFFALLGLSVLQIPPELFLAQEGLLWVRKWAVYFGVFFMAADLWRDPARRGRFLLVFQATMVLVCLNGLYQMAHGIDWFMGFIAEIPGRSVRMRSVFLWPNSFAIFLLFSVALAFSDWASETKWSLKAAGKAALLALFSICLILTFSRAVFLSLVTAVIVVLAAKKAWRHLGLVGLSILLFFFSSPLMRFNFWESLLWKDITVGQRLAFWKGAWGMIQAHPWLGSGVGTSIYLQGNYAQVPRQDYTHNAYLQIGAEIGLPALFIFIVPAIWLFTRFLSLASSWPARSVAIGTACLAFFGVAVAESSFYYLQPALLFWMFWGCLAAMLHEK